MPPNTVKVDRTTKWGNPFVPGEPAPFGPTKGAIVADRRHAFVLYRSLAPLNAALLAAARAELAGKNLACWCPFDNPFGAGHLGGPEGLIARLRASGYTVEPIMLPAGGTR